MDRDGSLRSLRWSLRQDKALDLVFARATITEGEPAAAPAPAPGATPAGEEKMP